MRREAFRNDGLPVPDIATNPSDPNYDVNGTWSQTENHDWQKELIGNFAAYTNLNMSFSGGNDLTQYTLRGTFNRQGSMFPGEYDDKRGALNFNLVSYSANKKLKIDFTGNYLKNTNLNAQFDVSPFTLRAPNAPASFKPDGTLNWGGPNSDNANNPYAYTVRSYENKTDNLVISFRPSYQLIKGLVASANIGLTKLDANITTTQPQSSYSPLYLALSPINPNLILTKNQQKTWIAEPQLNYDFSLIGVKMSALLGTTFQKSDNQGNYVVGMNFVSDALIGNIANAGTVQTADGGSYLYNYNALFGRLNANLDDKYIINLTGRRDGSSKFGPDRQFGNFYSAAMAWIFSSEKFAQDLTFLSLGKLRASYGTSGNDGINNYAYYDLYSRRSNTYQGATGFAPGALANPDVAWEKNAKLEFGLDLAFFNDRISLSSVYYNNRSSNQLLSYRLPSMTGYSSIPNYNFPALVENSGWEFILNTSNIAKKELQWNTSFNISINRNKLIKFDNLENSSYASSLEIGQPVTGRALAWVYAGIDPNTGLYTVRKLDGTTGSDAGSNLYAGHPVYETTRVLTLPKFFGGINNTLRYKGLQLDIFLQFVKQTGQQSLLQDVPGIFNVDVYSTGFISSNVPVQFLDRWQKPGDKARYQRYSQSAAGRNAYNSWLYSDASYVDASFIRAKNITLSYQLPGWLKDKMKLKNASINLSGQNLFTITSYEGRDPETQAFYILPPMKVFVAGLQINL
ncbi:SusC/RagA family TonB-linked outer membrane protein [Chitinophaga sedimenti]|uniref:SusC/RagA family TonB-linked outer membrane protein n=1 Tax=Chitinophaga sedimenti TaxID=2033606 RepID=UPI0020034B19|nr:SusC/RagA family TonB-linked outer membrane protein [Chitinophaga sedimenti]MCK7556523.1 SusC/RagA family TonB-linked outer membrane protein [Chitinophaga sedimenti]